MIHLFASAILLLAISQYAQAEDAHVYNYKVTQFYADILSNVQNRVSDRIDELEKTMVKRSALRKVARKYKDTIRSTKRSTYKTECPTTNDVTKLKELTDVFDNSLKECRSQADCKIDLPETSTKILNTIQEFDSDAFKADLACSDDACKLKVHENTRERLLKLYEDSLPALRVSIDQAISNNKCYSSILKCMVDKNIDSLKQMYSNIAKLEGCVDTSRVNSKNSSNLGNTFWHRSSDE